MKTFALILIAAALQSTCGESRQPEPAPQEQRTRYVRNPDGSVDGYGPNAARDAIREVHKQMAENPEGFRRYRECQQRCGYDPRDDDTPGIVTFEMQQEIRRRRESCNARGKRCIYPGRPWGEMAQPQQERGLWRATRQGLEEREER